MATFWGVDFAVSELALVLFTTLTPAGVVAVLALMAWRRWGGYAPELLVKLDRALILPLVVSMVGLVASASHLGTPGNALYVLTGVGRSPLSNEVVSGVVFLALLGIYWYRSFLEERSARARRIWRMLICLAGLLFVLLISLAYDVDTVPTWSNVTVPLALWLNALVAGPLLGLCALAFAGAGMPSNARQAWAAVIVSASALALGVALYLVQGNMLAAVGNFTVTAGDLVPWHVAGTAAYALLGGAGVVLGALGLRRAGRAAKVQLVASCVVALAGVFVMRFAFYAAHLTYGLGV